MPAARALAPNVTDAFPVKERISIPLSPAKTSSVSETPPLTRRMSLPAPPAREALPEPKEETYPESLISKVSPNLPPTTVRMPARFAWAPSSTSLAELFVLRIWIFLTLPKSSSAIEFCPDLEIARRLVPAPPSMVNIPNSVTWSDSLPAPPTTVWMPAAWATDPRVAADPFKARTSTPETL
jgi:hypothetical protein